MWNGTSAGWREHLESIETTAYEARSREAIRELNADPAPGFYVSAMNDSGGKLLAEGPFTRHEEALCAVWSVSQAWGKVDPRACWYAWGTAQVHAKGRR